MDLLRRALKIPAIETVVVTWKLLRLVREELAHHADAMPNYTPLMLPAELREASARQQVREIVRVRRPSARR